ncbi:MAG: glycosyltransferase family 2 protein [Nitrospirae bacterium]|nr:glycosyltransferase family 2 protein [Nitrospirota bacterium]MBI5696181.1 glycosyltransferase family 2 protein [Nitrospirota bacterium]
MNEIMSIVFWSCAGLVVYVYAGYYLCLRLLYAFRTVRVAFDPGYFPKVSVIVTSLNEERNIEARIKNLLELDYPDDKLEIIIGSDGSTDRTVEIASRYVGQGVVVHDFKVNRGRAAVHNDSVRSATGEIMVFTDAETSFDRGFLRQVVKYYADPKVGAVSGSLTYISRGNEFASAEGFYFKFEKMLRNLESRVGILTSGTGACFTIRKSLYRELPGTEDVDFALPIDCIKKGFRAHIEPEAVAYDFPPGTVKGVMKARSRMTAKAFSGLMRLCGLTFWFKHPMAGWGLMSRKILRWFTGFFMAGALVTNVALAGHGGIYTLALMLQAAFYGLYVAGWALNRAGMQARLPSWAFIFVTANVGMSLGILKALTGRVPSSYKRV